MAAPQHPPAPRLLYHLTEASRWEAVAAAGPGAKLYPPTYEADGFVHLTADPALLLGVANHFYRASPGAWVVLELQAAALTSRVVFEAAAPVGETPAHRPAGAAGGGEVLFPHLYGGIDAAAVARAVPVERDAATGEFLSLGAL